MFDLFRRFSTQFLPGDIEAYAKQMSKYFETIFDPFMSAYRKMYSCETTLVRLVEDWKHAIDHGKSVGVLSTDMSKAFDTMHSTLLLAKLKAYGFSEGALSLMRSFFKERKGRTKGLLWDLKSP